MESRVAVIGIIIENQESVQALNDILHEYSAYIVGRMGIPYREKNISIISVAMDAPQDVISAIRKDRPHSRNQRQNRLFQRCDEIGVSSFG